MNVLLAVKRRQIAVAQAEQIARIALETEGVDDSPSFKPKVPITAGGDSTAIRGLPAFMSGASAAIRGTKPGPDGVGLYAERGATVLI